MSHDFPTENIDSADVPVWAEATLPINAYLPMVVEQQDMSCGGNILALYNLELGRITPGSTFQTNTYSLAKNGSTIVVQPKTVVPAYVGSTLPNIITAASASTAVTKARFIVLSDDQNDSTKVIIQSSGIYSFPTTHGYIVGYQYYLSDTPGQVSTTPGTVSQPIFYVVDSKSILVNLEV